MKEHWKIAIVLAIASMISLGLLIYSIPGVMATDYTFGDETVNEGYSLNPSNRNAEDATYNELVEEDQYTDTNYSGSSENVVTGSGGGGSFPSALDTDDSTRRSYSEAEVGGGSPTYEILRPTGDSTPQSWSANGDSSNYLCIDETTAGGDSDTTYVSGLTGAETDYYVLGDMSDPGSVNIDVHIWVIGRDLGGSSNLAAGFVISGTPYVGVDTDPDSSYSNYTYEWTVNPYTTSEWTYSEINAMEIYLYAGDTNPDVYVTQIGVLIEKAGSGSYQLDAQITYSSVTGTSQTSGWMVYCQGYRSSTEDFAVQAWNYSSLGWIAKETIDAGSDTDFNFNLLPDEYDDVADEVKLRIVDGTPSSDTSQDTVYFDVLKVCSINEGYDLDIEMTASGTNEYGAQRLRIKALTSGETFNVAVYNWSSSGWDTDKITITELTNTWHTYDLIVEHHRSVTQVVKIQFTDGTAAASDTTQDTCYLDIAIVAWMYEDPTITLYHDNGPVNVGSNAQFWLNYTDGDNEAPQYVRVVIDSTPYDMAKNETDTTYYDGVNYSFSKSDLTGGVHPYYFAVKDANSGEVTTGEDSITINRAPTLTLDGVTPSTGNNGQTFYFYVNYTDLEDNAPDYIEVVIAGTPYTMAKNDSGDNSYDDGVNYSYSKAMAGGTHQYYFRTADYLSSMVSTTPKNLDVNNPPVLSGFTQWPDDPCYPTTQVYFNCTFTDADGDLPSAIKWRESEGATQNITMTATVPEDDDTTDGKLFYCAVYLSHGLHEYDFYAEDALSSTSGGDDSITIQNRDPIISNGPGTDPNEYRNTGWNYDFDGSDPDEDAIGWEVSGPGWLTINPSSGYLSGTTPDTVGNYGFTVYCNDSYGGSDSYAFTLHIVNRAPVIDSSGNTTQSLDTFMCYHVLYHDDDSDECTLEFSSNATWLSLSNEYVNGTATPVGWYWCKVWCNDSYGGSDLEEWDVTVSEYVNDPPTFTSTPITSISNNTFYSYDANATDTTEPPDTLTYDLEGNGTAFLSIHSSLGYVNGTPTSLGWWYVNISCSDGTSTVWQNFSLTSYNEAPYFTSTPILTGTNGTAYYYNAEATDNNTDNLQFALDDPPSWLFVDEDTGEVEGTPTLAGEYDVNLSVTDNLAVRWQNWTLTISEPPPAGSETERMTNDLITCMPAIIIIMAIAFAVIYVYGYIRHPPRQAKKDSGKRGGKKDDE